MDDTTVRTHSGWSGIRRPAPLAILPQDRVHVEIRHAAPKLQVGVRDRQERPRGLSRSHGLPSLPRRLLQVPDGRRNHCRPQTLTATPLLRRLLLSPLHLSLMAHEEVGIGQAALGRFPRRAGPESLQLEGPRRGVGRASSLRPLPDHIINNTVFLALFGGHDVIALRIVPDPRDRLSGVQD